MCKINKSPRIGNRPDHQNYRKIVALPFIAGIDKKSWYCQILAKLRGLRPPPEFTNLAPGRATSGCRTGSYSFLGVKKKGHLPFPFYIPRKSLIAATIPCAIAEATSFLSTSSLTSFSSSLSSSIKGQSSQSSSVQTFQSSSSSHS